MLTAVDVKLISLVHLYQEVLGDWSAIAGYGETGKYFE